MQISPHGQKAAQEPLKSSAEADLSDEQHNGPQQKQGTGRQGNANRHCLWSFQETVIGRSKRKNRDSRCLREPRFTFGFSFSSILLLSC